MSAFKSIDKNGYYVGSEVRFSVEDVYMTAEDLGLAKLSEHDAKRVLVSAFEDNQYIMGILADAIRDTLEWMVLEKEIGE